MQALRRDPTLVNAVDTPLDGRSPLHHAAHGGIASSVRLLLEHGAFINAKDSSGRTALHVACEQGKTGVVRVLLENKAAINAQDRSKRTPLVCAIESASSDVAMQLIKNNASVKGPLAGYPLLCAARNGSEGVLELLLANGGDPNESLGVSSTLNEACLFGTGRMVQMLLDRGATPSVLSMIATGDVKGLEKVKMSIPRESRRESSEAASFLHVAIRLNQEQSVVWLLGHGISPDAVHERTFPLHAAVSQNSKVMVDRLLSHGADLNCRDAKGRTVLHIASELNSLIYLKRFISLGMSPNTPDANRDTPLHCAVEGMADKAVFFELLVAGGKLDAKNARGKTVSEMIENSEMRDVYLEAVRELKVPKHVD